LEGAVGEEFGIAGALDLASFVGTDPGRSDVVDVSGSVEAACMEHWQVDGGGRDDWAGAV
jgi:hypothetical protein